jgi:cell division protein FtsN
VPPAARAPVAVPPPPAKPQTPPHPAADVAPGPAVVPHPAPATVVAAHPAAPAALTPPPHAGATGAWTVLANPTQNRDEADALTRQLRGRGYDATLVRVVRDGGTWYRVQVGRFATSDQASETMHRLREHEGVTHAFVASE